MCQCLELGAWWRDFVKFWGRHDVRTFSLSHIISSASSSVQIWRMDPGNITKEYPFVCRSVISTGHRANIFNVQMLPYSSRMCVWNYFQCFNVFTGPFSVTVAGDKEVRVFDVEIPSKYDVSRNEYSSAQCRTHTLLCHQDRVKRIVTEESPDSFLTVAEVCDKNWQSIDDSNYCTGQYSPSTWSAHISSVSKRLPDSNCTHEARVVDVGIISIDAVSYRGCWSVSLCAYFSILL